MFSSKLLRGLGGHTAESVLATYRSHDPQATSGNLLAQVLSDLAYSWESIKIASVFALHETNSGQRR